MSQLHATRRWLGATALAAGVLTGAQAAAAILTWNVNGDGVFNTGSNWSSGSVPNDVALFGKPGFDADKVVTFTGNVSLVGGLAFTNTGKATLENSAATSPTVTLTSIALGENAGAVTLRGNSGGGALTLSMGTGPTFYNNSPTSLLTVAGTIDIPANGRPLTFLGAGSSEISGAIINSNTAGGGVVVVATTGDGTVTLSNSANTFTGGVTTHGGTAVLTGLNTSGTANLLLTGGNTILDLTAGNNRWNSSGTVTLQGGTLTVKGNSSGSSSQTLGNLSIAGGVSTLRIDPNGGAGTTLTLGNTWNRTGGGGTLLIDLSSSGAVLLSNPTLSNSLIEFSSIAAAVVKDSSGIGFATVSSGTVVRYTGATELANSSTSGNRKITADGSTLVMTDADHDIATLAIDTSANSGVLDLGTTSTTRRMQLTAGRAVLMTGGHDFTIQNGTLGVPGSDLIFHQYGTGALTLNGQLASSASLVKSGPGRLILSQSQVYSGKTSIEEGVLDVTVANLGTGVINLCGGVLQSSGTFTRALGTTTGNVRWTEVNTLSGDGGGFAARGGTLVVNLGGASGTNTWNDTYFVTNGKRLLFGSLSADNLVDYQNGIGLGRVQREIMVVDNPGSTGDIARISGQISSTDPVAYPGAAGGILKTGDGVLELTASNTYTGRTVIQNGTLKAGNASAFGTGGVTVGNGVLDLRDFNVANTINITGTGASVLLPTSTGALATSFAAGSRFGGWQRSSGASVANLLSGTASALRTVTSAWTNDSHGSGNVVSDVIDLNGTGADVFVLQLTYANSALNDANAMLGYWKDNTSWVNAIYGGSYSGDGLFVDGAYNGSLALGTWGRDTESNTVWAVVDHNSEFAVVVPEPAMLALLAIGSLAFLRRRK